MLVGQSEAYCYQTCQIITPMITAPMTYLGIELFASLLDSGRCSDVVALGISGAGAGLVAARVFFAGTLGAIWCSGLAPSTQATHRRP